jgi:hypothetical protein
MLTNRKGAKVAKESGKRWTMITLYPTVYRDKHGEEKITIESTGTSLRTVIRGVEFTGVDFQLLKPTIDKDSPDLATFMFNNWGDLSDCFIECEIPILVVVDDVEKQGYLLAEIHNPVNARVEYLARADKKRISLRLILRYDGLSFEASGFQTGGWFEIDMFAIQKELPQGVYMKTCVQCAFGAYSPYGQGMFGDMACFRDNKEGIRNVRNKSDLFKVWDTMTEYVQETYLCSEFEKWKKES